MSPSRTPTPTDGVEGSDGENKLSRNLATPGQFMKGQNPNDI